MNGFIPMSLLGEFLGTMILILIGNGVVYATSHSKMFANQPGKWVLISIAWALAVFTGAMVANALEAPGHLNPAVSIYAMVASASTGFVFYPLIFIPMQFLGAMVGQCVLNFINWKHIIDTASENNSATRGSHCTNPAYDNKKDKATIFNFSYELVGTLLLVLAIYCVGKLPIENVGLVTSGPIPVSLVIMAIGMALGSSTGYALNPARDLGPRIIYALSKNMIENKSNSKIIDANWSYSYIPVIAPIIAGIIMGGFANI